MNLDALWVLPSDIDPELELDEIDPSDQALMKDYDAALAACEWATQTLWALSGRKFHTGITATEQYLVGGRGSTRDGIFSVRGAAVYDKEWGVFLIDPYDWGMKMIRLDGHPVKQVGSVTDLGTGRDLEGHQYSLVNKSWLRLETTVSEGIEVSYTFGQDPPRSGRMAALAMAREFYFLWSGREDQCELPSRVTSVNRQGVSWVLLDNQDFLADLRTGIFAVDLFLKTVNPDKARLKAKVFSVDMPRGRRRSL